MNAGPGRDGSRVTIERLRCTYLVAHEHPAPDSVRGRLDAAMRQLPAVCGQLLDPLLDTGDPSVWLIRRLDLDLTLEAGLLDDDRLAHLWGTRIVAALAGALAGRADGESILHFADRAAYLAQFCGDLAEDRAWGKWYYRPLESLRSLPTGAGIRQALVREPELAAQVLQQVAVQGRLDRVLNVLSEGDAQAVYAVCAAGGGAGTTRRQTIDALLAAWPAAGLQAVPSLASRRNALRLFLAVQAQAPQLAASGDLAGAIDHLLGLAALLRQLGAPAGLLARLAAGDLAGAVAIARQAGVTAHLESLPVFQQAATGDRAWLDQVARTLLPAGAQAAPAKDAVEPAAPALSTRSAGIFLLLPTVLDLAPPEFLASCGYPAAEDVEPAQSRRLVLALKCLGRPQAAEVFHDAALQLALGLETPLSFDALDRFSAAADAEMDRRCLDALLAILVRQRRIEGRCLAAESGRRRRWAADPAAA